MPRPPRDDFSGARHHVMSRGARRQPVFRDPRHGELFLALLADLPRRFAMRIHGFALMPNHFHLMLESDEGRLSRAMAYLLARYTVESNRLHDWDGPVFRGRFHSRPVYEDQHWMHLLAYVHLNPIRSRLEMRLGQYRWTSHRFYAGTEAQPAWLTTAELLGMLDPFGGYAAYLQGVRARRAEEPEGFDAVVFAGRRGTDAATPVPKRRRLSTPVPAEAVLRRVAALAECPVAQLREVTRGRNGNPARTAAAYALVHDSRLSHREIAALLDMSPTDISRALLKVRNRTPGQEQLCRIVAELEARRR
jgi:REP element-mobilizing transposase RayT